MNDERMKASDELTELSMFDAVRRGMKQRPCKNKDEYGAECNDQQPRARKHSASDAPQERDAPDRQPLGNEDVAAAKEDCRVRGDELSRRELAARLIAARTYVTVRCFAVAQLSYDVVIAIENANLAVQVRADHPIALSVKVARHSQMGFVFDGTDVRAR